MNPYLRFSIITLFSTACIIYVLTPKGFSEKTKLTVNFMKTKMKEYDELKAELKKAKGKQIEL